MLSIAELNIYPVKSCRGIALDSASLTERGLEHDRKWMIVEDAGEPARFLTQREVPGLALIGTAIRGEGLELTAAGRAPLSIAADRDGPRRNVTVWRDTFEAIDEGDVPALWLSSLTGRSVRLVRFPARHRRLCNTLFAGDSGAHTGFADGYPLLVLSRASLAELNRRLAANGQPALPMNRFRPNLVVEGAEAHDEDHWAGLSSPDFALRLVKPCVRCAITTTDQRTAIVGTEPLLTLAGYRDDATFGGVTFGMNAIIESGTGAILRVGQPLEAAWNFGD